MKNMKDINLQEKTIKYNSKNEKIKQVFFEILENAKGKDKKTIKVYANAIHEFEKTTNFKDFKTFTTKQAVDFKEYLATKKNKRTGKTISKSYLRCATYLKIFFEFLTTLFKICLIIKNLSLKN